MGFLSKLFGGDAGSTSVKPDATEAPRATPATGDTPAQPAPSSAKADSARAVQREAAPAQAPERDAKTLVAEKAAAKKEVPAEKAAEKPAPKAANAAASPKVIAPKAAGDKAPADKTTAAKVPAPNPAPPKAATKPAAAAGGAEKSPPSSVAQPLPGDKAPGARPVPNKRALEESILTSAPKLTVDAAGPGAARPPAKAPPAPASEGQAQAQEAPKSSERRSLSSIEAANLATFRSRRDKMKSPGFYSVSPANGSHAVPGAASSANLMKATVVGIAPPPEPSQAVRADKGPEPDAAGAALASAGAALENFAPLSPEESAPPQKIKGGAQEKEDTSPGLGTNRSRHDPAAPVVALPDKDLELVVEFVIALSMGSVAESWLPPIRSALAELRTVAGHSERGGLEKALGLLSKELDEPGDLSDERRLRILRLFTSVDVALPRPVDIAARKAQRERLILEQLLLEVATIHPLIPQRLRDEGVATLDRLARANMDELALRVAADREQADQIASTLRSYLSARAHRGPDTVILGKSRAIRERLRALEASAEDFERASDSEDVEARRSARRRRQADVVQLNLLLAEFGEASILNEIERCSVQGKIERLGRWLRELDAS